ncbi:MAG: beta-lactamase family protein [Victivallales bacterium]|nr:beta-lactamase family protein [Victivallales bacterium]
MEFAVKSAAIQAALDQATAKCIFPCGVLMRKQADNPPEFFCSGKSVYGDGGFKPDAHSLFDLASLTKVVATTTLAMMAYEEGSLDLDKPVSAWLPDFMDGDHPEWRAIITPRMLLAHTAGFVPFLPFYRTYVNISSRPEKQRIVRLAPLHSQPNAETVYSDIGMMVMGQIVETILRKRLDAAVWELVFKPLEMLETTFNPPSKQHCVPTEEMADKPGHFWTGIVHDENARWLDGVSGHAGLFSTAADLERFSNMLLENGRPLLHSRHTLQLFASPANLLPGSTRCLGWTHWSAVHSSFGHTGFTGISLWIVPDQGLATLLLTNAVHPHRECKQNGYFDTRDHLHALCLETSRP